MALLNILIALALVLHFLDMLQTIQIARNPVRWYEKNFILGRHPTVAAVVMYFLLTALTFSQTSLLLWAATDGWVSYAAPVVWVLVGLAMVAHNRYRLKIPFWGK